MRVGVQVRRRRIVAVGVGVVRRIPARDLQLERGHALLRLCRWSGRQCRRHVLRRRLLLRAHACRCRC